MSVEYARKIINSGMYFIPLLPNEKKNFDKDFLTRDYSESDLFPDGNVGVNPRKSEVYIFDLDTSYAIKFGDLWLPKLVF